MADLSELSRLSASTGIALPHALIALVESGLAGYPEDYNRNFIAVSTTRPVALSSVCDFEWLGDGQATETVADWLNAEYQQGARFLPFAQSGAGDQYCLVQSEAGVGCGMIWHDSESSTLGYRSFEHFVCGSILSTLQDMTHLLEEGFSEADAANFVRLDARQVLSTIPDQLAAPLALLLSREPAPRPYRPAPKAREMEVLSFISSDEHDRLQAKYTQDPPPIIPIRARWELT
jgi:hypothetical protein